MKNKSVIKILNSKTLGEVSSKFMLHNHDREHELLLFIRGDAKYYVEGSTFTLKPYNLAIAGSSDLHRVMHNPKKTYERISILLDTDFFTMNDCEMYEKIFKSGIHLIASNTVLNSGIYDCITKLTEHYKNGEALLVKCKTIELLYLLNKNLDDNLTDNEQQSVVIQRIISYIGDNIADNLDLKTLSKEFFLSPNHINRLFKNRTGYTVKKYVTKKRLLYVHDLCRKGKSLIEASKIAGFTDYSSFYRTCIIETGHTPKEEYKIYK